MCLGQIIIIVTVIIIIIIIIANDEDPGLPKELCDKKFTPHFVRLFSLELVIVLCKKYKTFSVWIYRYGNWKKKPEKLCGNTMPAGRIVITKFRVFRIFTSVDVLHSTRIYNFFYYRAREYIITSTEERRDIFDYSDINTALSQ